MGPAFGQRQPARSRRHERPADPDHLRQRRMRLRGGGAQEDIHHHNNHHHARSFVVFVQEEPRQGQDEQQEETPCSTRPGYRPRPRDAVGAHQQQEEDAGRGLFGGQNAQAAVPSGSPPASAPAAVKGEENTNKYYIAWHIKLLHQSDDGCFISSLPPMWILPQSEDGETKDGLSGDELDLLSLLNVRGLPGLRSRAGAVEKQEEENISPKILTNK